MDSANNRFIVAPADKYSQLCCVGTNRQPFRAQASLPIQKLCGSYSGRSYIPVP